MKHKFGAVIIISIIIAAAAVIASLAFNAVRPDRLPLFRPAYLENRPLRQSEMKSEHFPKKLGAKEANRVR